MTRAEIRARIFHGLNEDPSVPVFWSTAEMDQVIDEAAEVLAEEIGAVRRTAHIVLQDSTTYYTLRSLAPDVLAPWRLWHVPSERRLDPVTMEQLDRFHREWIKVDGDPWHWFPLSWDTFGIFPRPSTTGGVLRVDYLAWPRALIQDDEHPEMPEADHEALVTYGIYDGLAKRWDQMAAVTAWSIFERQWLGGRGRRASAISPTRRLETSDPTEQPGLANR